jgi:hypothetical protein
MFALFSVPEQFSLASGQRKAEKEGRATGETESWPRFMTFLAAPKETDALSRTERKLGQRRVWRLDAGQKEDETKPSSGRLRKNFRKKKPLKREAYWRPIWRFF